MCVTCHLLPKSQLSPLGPQADLTPGLGPINVVFSWFLPPEEGSYKSIHPSRSKVSMIKTVDQRLPLQTQEPSLAGKSRFLRKA